MGSKRTTGSPTPGRPGPRPERRAYAIALGRVVELFRERMKMDRKALALAVGVSPATISRIEKGQVLPNQMLFADVARTLGVSNDEMSGLVADALATVERFAGAAKAQQRELGEASATLGLLSGALAAQDKKGWAALVGVAGTVGLISWGVSMALSRRVAEDALKGPAGAGPKKKA